MGPKLDALIHGATCFDQYSEQVLAKDVKLPKAKTHQFGKRVPGGPAEAEILKDILAWLKECRFTHWRINTQGMIIHTGNGTAAFAGSRSKGMADIVGLFRASGRMFCIEVKAPGGRVSAEQKNFLDAVNLSGGLGFVAISLDDVVREFQKADALTHTG